MRARSEVAQAPRSVCIFSADLPQTISPTTHDVATHQKSPSAVTEPSALALALAFRHLIVGAGRILANLEISSPEAASGCREGRARSISSADASNLFQFSRRPPRRDSSQERHHLRTSTEPPTTAVADGKSATCPAIRAFIRRPDLPVSSDKTHSQASPDAIGSPGRLVVCELPVRGDEGQRFSASTSHG